MHMLVLLYLVRLIKLILLMLYKMLLFDLLNADCEIGGAKYALSYAVEIFVQSFSQSLFEKKNLLKFPVLQEIKRHQYE